MAWLLNAVNAFLAQGATVPRVAGIGQGATPPQSPLTSPPKGPQPTPPFFARMMAPDTMVQPPTAAPAQPTAPDTMAKPPAQSPDLPKLPEPQQTTEGKPQPPAAIPPAQPNQPTAQGSPPLSEDEYFKAHPEAIPARPVPTGLAARPAWQQEGAKVGMGVLSGLMNMGTRPGVDPRTHPNNTGTDFLNKWQANQKAAADAPAQYDQDLAKMRADAYNTYLKQQGDVAGIGEKQANTKKAGGRCSRSASSRRYVAKRAEESRDERREENRRVHERSRQTRRSNAASG
jgi:hypothetical protein